MFIKTGKLYKIIWKKTRRAVNLAIYGDNLIGYTKERPFLVLEIKDNELKILCKNLVGSVILTNNEVKVGTEKLTRDATIVLEIK